MGAILYIVQHADALRRADLLLQNVAEQSGAAHLVVTNASALDDKHFKLTQPVASYTLREFLEASGHTVTLVICDSPDTLLVSERELEIFCPRAKRICFLHEGPLESHLAAQHLGREEMRSSLHRCLGIVYSTREGRQAVSELRINDELLFSLIQPFMSQKDPLEKRRDSICFFGDWNNSASLERAQIASAALRASSDEQLLLWSSGPGAPPASLVKRPSGAMPEISCFVDEDNCYDHFALFETLAVGSLVISSAPARYGFSIVHQREYLEANHPRTIVESIDRLKREEALASDLQKSAQAYVKTYFQYDRIKSEYAGFSEWFLLIAAGVEAPYRSRFPQP